MLVEYLQCSWFVYFYLLFIEIKGHPAQRTPPYFLQPIFLQPTSNCRKETNQQQEIRNSEVAKKWPKQHATQPIAFQRSDIVATPIVLFFFVPWPLSYTVPIMESVSSIVHQPIADLNKPDQFLYWTLLCSLACPYRPFHSFLGCSFFFFFYCGGPWALL